MSTFRELLDQGIARFFGAGARRSGARRLGVEVLEDRTTPAPVVYAVTNVADSGAGSLRQALLDHLTVSKDAGDAIYFQIPNPNGAVLKIDLQTNLPEITIPVRIDGTQQQGYKAATPVVQLNDAGAGTRGLHLSGGDSVVTGVRITGFDSQGILITDKGNNEVYNCYLGTDGVTVPMGGVGMPPVPGQPPGVAVNLLGNGTGIEISSSSNKVGAYGKGNLISGNKSFGVAVDAPSNETISDNLIQANFIGTNAAGNGAIPNNLGVVIGASDSINFFGVIISTKIGGTVEPGVDPGNVISGNLTDGIRVTNLTSETTVAGNYIGLTVTGLSKLGNGGSGVSITNGSNKNVIGGTVTTDADPGNVISGNGGDGVSLLQEAEFEVTGANLIRGNYIGLDKDGVAAIGNAKDGVNVSNDSGNKIGGTGG